MKVEISVFAICILIYLINEVLSYRLALTEVKEDEGGKTLFIFLIYAIKTIIIIIGLNYITK